PVSHLSYIHPPHALRAPHSFPTRRSSDLGTIVTDTEHAGRFNRVAGGDLDFRPSSTQEVSATFLESQTGLNGANSAQGTASQIRSEEHTSELQSRSDLVCRLLLEKKNECR